MHSIRRRSFLTLAAAALAASAIEPSQTDAAPSSQAPVVFTGDGLSLSPLQYANLLSTIAAKESFRRDTYLKSGPVEELEHAMATLLGKERALFLPNGTLANHLAKSEEHTT